MSDEYKLALSRSRLFEFNSTVTFFGKLKEAFDEAELQKALKMLCLKEPVITAVAELRKGGEAFLVTQSVEQTLVLGGKTKDELLKEYEKNPLKFSEKLFEFVLSSDGYLVIVGHTLVSDAKSLLRLSGSILAFYNKSSISVEPEKIFTFSEEKSLPVDVISPLTKKLSAELDYKFQKDLKRYGVEGYEKARKAFLESFPETAEISKKFTTREMKALRDFCEGFGVDLSSFVYFAFYKSLMDNTDVGKTNSRMRIYADRRFFHGTKENYSVGAYNGTVNVSLNKKERKKNVSEQLKLFHVDTYRALTSAFRVFNDDVLFMQVNPSLCDASYIYLAGLNKSKSVKNFAKTYGCKSAELCDCLYCNLNQGFWADLKGYEEIGAFEPFKLRSQKMITFIETDKGGDLYFKYFVKDMQSALAQRIFDCAVDILTDEKLREKSE